MDPIVDRPRRVSLDEVAAAVGVSKATACRALLGRSRVSEDTRAKIKAAAEKLGYRPDPALSALTKHRWALGASRQATYQIALVRVLGPDFAGSVRTRINTSDTVGAIRSRAHELGLMLSEWVLEEQHSPAHLGRMLYSRGVDGLLFNIEGPLTRWDFPWQHFASVVLGHDHDTHPAHSVVPDWFRALGLAVSKAREAGKKRMGFASFHRRNPGIDDLLNGAILRHRELLAAEFGPQPEVLHYPQDDRNIRDCYEPERKRFGAWLRREKPDVIIDTNRIAFWWLRDLGIEPPARYGYITTVGQAPHEADGQAATLSSVSLRRDQQGRSAVELLFNLLQLNQRGLPEIPVRLAVASGWVEGSTLRR